ncbi:hypothetical protein P7K49_027294, partial [Saguinus oedipus]
APGWGGFSVARKSGSHAGGELFGGVCLLLASPLSPLFRLHPDVYGVPVGGAGGRRGGGFLSSPLAARLSPNGGKIRT